MTKYKVWLLLMGLHESLDIVYDELPELYLDINNKRILHLWYKKKQI